MLNLTTSFKINSVKRAIRRIMDAVTEDYDTGSLSEKHGLLAITELFQGSPEISFVGTDKDVFAQLPEKINDIIAQMGECCEDEIHASVSYNDLRGQIVIEFWFNDENPEENGRPAWSRLDITEVELPPYLAKKLA